MTTPTIAEGAQQPDAATLEQMRQALALSAADPRSHLERLPRRLSPSRLADFLHCPRAFAYRVIVKLTSPPTMATAVGTLTHQVAEHLFDQPADRRTLDVALGLVPTRWAAMTHPPTGPGAPEPGSRDWVRAHESASRYLELAPPGSDEEAEILRRAEDMVAGWFAIERVDRIDPTRVPLPGGQVLDGREVAVGATIGGVYVHGSIDRVDSWDTGAGPAYAISDYKTGKVPGAGKDYPAHVKEKITWDAFRQLRIYALLMWHAHKVPVRVLRLVHVATGDRATGLLTQQVTGDAMRRTEHELTRSWAQIQAAARSGDWPPSPGPLCSWCYFAQLCPAGPRS
jgi:putative RecB family exonuclease